MTLEILLAHPAVQALGRALLHFIWQGSLLALFLWIVKTIAPSSAARLRYAAASLIMLMMPIALIVTATWNVHSEPGRAAAAPRFSIQAPAHMPEQAVYYAPTSSAPHAGISGWAVCIWLIGVLLLSARAAGGWMGVQELKRGASPADAELEDVVKRLQRRLRISAPVRLCTSAAVRVPTAIGWLRPYILLPVTALTGLSEAQIVAILTHELAHIRRNDYLVNILQTVIETVLFYHPAVWWVGRQMRLEREHCCDDIAVAVCGSAFEYASALAEMEQIRDRIPTPALAATGGDLLGRIRWVLGREDRTPRSLGSILAAALALSIAGATAIVSLYAATQEAPPAFEVASIKRNIGGEHINYRRPFPTLHVEGSTLKDLVISAYQVHDFQVTGGPVWIDSDLYNIDAKAEAHPVANQQFVTLQRRRLQTLLRDRFHLTIHRETKELPVYELTVAKGGPKLQPSNCVQRVTGDTAIAPGKTQSDYCGATGIGRSRIQGRGVSMAFLSDILSGLLSRTVVDKTGLKGEFQIQLTYTPVAPSVPSPDAAPPGRADGAATPDRGPDIFTAVQEQLGLKLQSGKGPVEVLVIDHVERPSEN
jgi:uncharacterized protein (TIGR03435 family)